jgi:integrase
MIAADERVDALRERLQAGERGGSERDRELLLKFSDEMYFLREEYGDNRHEKLLRHMTIVSENAGPLEPLLEDTAAVKDTVRWIHQEYDNPETNRDYRIALRVFGKRVTEGDDVPDSLDIVSAKTPRDYDPSPKASDLLRWEEDIKPMIEAAMNPRDKAAIALQMDAGLRGESELYRLRRGDIVDSPEALRVVVDGKTGEREVALVPSTPHVSRWLDEHPSDDPDAPMWCKLSAPEQLSYPAFLKMFKEPARRAGVEKRVTPTILRKSNATWLARMGANAALIEDRQGRSRGSDAVARYVATFGGKDATTQYRALHGEDVERETPEDHAPIECDRCGKDNPADAGLCMWCGQALDPIAANTIAEAQEAVYRGRAAADDEATEMAIDQLFEALMDDPKFRSKAVQRLQDQLDVGG